MIEYCEFPSAWFIDYNNNKKVKLLGNVNLSYIKIAVIQFPKYNYNYQRTKERKNNVNNTWADK